MYRRLLCARSDPPGTRVGIRVRFSSGAEERFRRSLGDRSRSIPRSGDCRSRPRGADALRRRIQLSCAANSGPAGPELEGWIIRLRWGTYLPCAYVQEIYSVLSCSTPSVLNPRKYGPRGIRFNPRSEPLTSASFSPSVSLGLVDFSGSAIPRCNIAVDSCRRLARVDTKKRPRAGCAEPRTNYFQPRGNMVGEPRWCTLHDSVIFIFHSRLVTHYLADRATASR